MAITVSDFTSLQAACQSNNDITVAAPISFTSMITIPSGVSVTITGAKLTAATSRHFGVDGNLTLQNIILDGGGGVPVSGASGGGGILLPSNGIGLTTLLATLPNVVLGVGSVIQNCTSAQSTIQVGAGSLQLEGAFITQNYDKWASSGGIIRTDTPSGSLTMGDGTVISNNITLGAGGAFHISNGSQVTMTGGSILGNQASNIGGAIYMDNANNHNSHVANPSTGATTLFDMSGGVIAGNSSSHDGGGLYVGTNSVSGTEYGVAANIIGSNTGPVTGVLPTDLAWPDGSPAIYQNQAGANGGGIFSQHHTTTVTNALIGSNQAATNGGGLYLAGDAVANLANVQIQNNTAQNGGGWYNQATLTVDKGVPAGQDSTISNNTASQSGGGGYVSSSGTFFDHGANYASNTAGNGGGLFVAGGKGYVYGSTVTQNITSANGGGFYVDTSSFVFSKGLTLTHNKSRLGKGGGAYVLGQFITAEVEIHYNSAAVCGGGVCVE
ncbi:MAG: hypothetical protein FWF59_10630 [Turicibacter sp.]|nr:hypothetical protein [Turicibacter sp.]